MILILTLILLDRRRPGLLGRRRSLRLLRRGGLHSLRRARLARLVLAAAPAAAMPLRLHLTIVG